MGRTLFGDIFANNFGYFWNNSTKFGLLVMGEIQFPAKF